MFIRNQERDILVNLDFVYVPTVEGCKTEVHGRKDGAVINLGKYCCGERALEVLNTIQDAMEDGTECNEYSALQQWNRKFIFEMPVK